MQTLRRIRNQRGAALLETAITIPIILAISVSIFEFGRAFQAWQVLTNAAREGARVAVLADTREEDIKKVVKDYLEIGGFKPAESKLANVTVQRTLPFGQRTASQVTVEYPFNFMVLNPVIRLLRADSKVGQPITMKAEAFMRNES